MSSSAPIYRLPSVLVHLTMQWLPLGETLKLARSNRQLLGQADSPFAFKFVKPMRVGLFALPEVDVAAAPTIHPLRHVRLSVYLDRELTLSRDPGSDPLPVLRRLPLNVDSFTISDSRVREFGVLLAFASHPSVAHLRSLVIGEDSGYRLDTDTISAIAKMQNLTSLSLRMQAPSEDLVRGLETSPTLTSLSLNDSSFRAPSILGGLYGCCQLRALSVRTPWLYDTQFVSVFATPCFRGLESMVWDHTVLYGDELQPAMQTAWARQAFASMHALREFTVRFTFGIDVLMPAVSAAPALHLFTIDGNCSPRDTSQMNVLPSPQLTCELLRDAPNLSIVLDMSVFHHDLRTEYADRLERTIALMDEPIQARFILRRCTYNF